LEGTIQGRGSAHRRRDQHGVCLRGDPAERWSANYGAAKAAIAALTLVAADELERYGVRVNAIAPIARTRLTLATPGMGALMVEPGEGEADLFGPANISPLVAYLATAKCPITGRVYAVQGGAISQLGGWHDVDTIETDGVWEIDDVAARLPY
jgi:NAD(P)-dependent dehydrogenase (short-subunit alcohol dehydrogenase family)